jgi:hypothetical protein
MLFWISSILFFSLSFLLLSSRSPTVLYGQILAGSLIFASSKIGRKFLGLE